MHTTCAQFQLTGLVNLLHRTRAPTRSGTTFVQPFLTMQVITEPMLRLSLVRDTHVLGVSW